MPKVSIIIPVYNSEKYLRKCIESAINQSFKDIEIICINDGSTDSSRQILEEYAQKDNRIKTINKVNGGISSARNTGLDITSGEYCYFIDPDDWIELDTIEKLVNIIQNNDIDVVVHNTLNIPETEFDIKDANSCNKWFESLKQENGIHKVPIEIKKHIASVVWNKLYKMDIIKKYNCRFPEGLFHEDELFFWAYMIHCKNYYYLDNKLYNYLRHSNSIMSTIDNSPMVLDILDILCQIYKTVEKYKNIDNYQEYLIQYYVKYTNKLLQRIPEKYHKEALIKIKEYYTNVCSDKRILKLYRKYKYKKLNQFIKDIFSVTNSEDKKHKIVTVLGIKIKLKTSK